jgi:hypothetical protein
VNNVEHGASMVAAVLLTLTGDVDRPRDAHRNTSALDTHRSPHRSLAAPWRGRADKRAASGQPVGVSRAVRCNEAGAFCQPASCQWPLAGGHRPSAARDLVEEALAEALRALARPRLRLERLGEASHLRTGTAQPEPAPRPVIMIRTESSD